MQRTVKKSLIEFQKDAGELNNLKGLVKSIGVKYVAAVTGLNDQTISDFLNCRYGTEKTKSLIIQSLDKANDLRNRQEKQSQTERELSILRYWQRIGYTDTASKKGPSAVQTGLMVCDLN